MIDQDKSDLDFEKAMRSPTFCLYPFTHVNFKVDGRTAPCFRSAPVGDGFSSDADWNSHKWSRLRRDLIEGHKNPTCESCWSLEKAGVSSYRQSSLKPVQPFVGWRPCLSSYNKNTGEMDAGPKQIELRFSNECNFQCRMCGPLYSSKWERHLEQDQGLVDAVKETIGVSYQRRQLEDVRDKDSKYNSRLLQAIRQWSESLEYIMIAGGEPLMQKQHLEALHILGPFSHRITLEYSTNLSLLRAHGEDIMDHWKNFKSLILKVSIDGDPLNYSYIRRYGDINKLRANVEQVHLGLGHNLSRFLGTLTTSIYNISRVPEAIEFITEMGLLFHSSQVQQPLTLSSQVLPKAEKLKVTERLENYLLDLDRHLGPLFDRHPVWRNNQMMNSQRQRVQQHVRQIIDFMNHEDCSPLFNKFLDYDRVFNLRQAGSIFDIYPHWKEYAAQV
jgi:organic radical activating enzyme